MANEKTEIFIWGSIISAIVGIYGFFVKHIIGHADKEEISDQIKKLWEEKQSVGRCEEIVKRMDENHKETCRKLDRILEKVDK